MLKSKNARIDFKKSMIYEKFDKKYLPCEATFTLVNDSKGAVLATYCFMLSDSVNKNLKS